MAFCQFFIRGENMRTKNRRAGIATALLAAICCLSSTCVVAEGLPLLFNGKDFAGWKVPEHNGKFPLLDYRKRFYPLSKWSPEKGFDSVDKERVPQLHHGI